MWLRGSSVSGKIIEIYFQSCGIFVGVGALNKSSWVTLSCVRDSILCPVLKSERACIIVIIIKKITLLNCNKLKIVFVSRCTSKLDFICIVDTRPLR